jgi:hypothetical protein
VLHQLLVEIVVVHIVKIVLERRLLCNFPQNLKKFDYLLFLSKNHFNYCFKTQVSRKP